MELPIPTGPAESITVVVQSPDAFVDGMVPAVLIGSVFVAVGAVVAFAIPRARRANATDATLVVSAPSEPVEGDVAPAYLTIDD